MSDILKPLATPPMLRYDIAVIDAAFVPERAAVQINPSYSTVAPQDADAVELATVVWDTDHYVVRGGEAVAITCGTDGKVTGGNLTENDYLGETPFAVGIQLLNVDGASYQLVDRTINRIADAGSRVDLILPAETSGKARDFLVRIEPAAGLSAAPEIVWPNTTIETPDGNFPEVAAGAVTFLYFTETKRNVFLVKSDQVSIAWPKPSISSVSYSDDEGNATVAVQGVFPTGFGAPEGMDSAIYDGQLLDSSGADIGARLLDQVSPGLDGSLTFTFDTSEVTGTPAKIKVTHANGMYAIAALS